MVSTHTDQIDFDEIERQGLKAIDKDARYWRENDAKFRAVNQKVATYEEFRDIVLASHLKPLDKKDKIEFGPITQKPSSCWNAVAKLGVGNSGTAQSAGINGSEMGEFSDLPKIPAEFFAYWRKLLSPELRYKFLSSFPPDAVREIFQTEIPAGLLVEIVDVLNLSCSSKDNSNANSSAALQAVSLLQQLSQSSRFTLTLMFLSDKEKSAIKTLFSNFDARINASDSALLGVVKDLKVRYSVE